MSETNADVMPTKAEFFSIAIPADARLNVEADSLEQAQEIVRAMLGDGRWIGCTGPFNGFIFGLRIK